MTWWNWHARDLKIETKWLIGRICNVWKCGWKHQNAEDGKQKGLEIESRIQIHGKSHPAEISTSWGDIVHYSRNRTCNDEESKIFTENEVQSVQGGLENFNFDVWIDCGDMWLEKSNKIRSLDGKRPKVCIKITHMGQVRSHKIRN